MRTFWSSTLMRMSVLPAPFNASAATLPGKHAFSATTSKCRVGAPPSSRAKTLGLRSTCRTAAANESRLATPMLLTDFGFAAVSIARRACSSELDNLEELQTVYAASQAGRRMLSARLVDHPPPRQRANLEGPQSQMSGAHRQALDPTRRVAVPTRPRRSLPRTDSRCRSPDQRFPLIAPPGVKGSLRAPRTFGACWRKNAKRLGKAARCAQRRRDIHERVAEERSRGCDQTTSRSYLEIWVKETTERGGAPLR